MPGARRNAQGKQRDNDLFPSLHDAPLQVDQERAGPADTLRIDETDFRDLARE